MAATQLILPRPTTTPPLTGPPTFGHARWIAKRGTQQIDARRIHRAAEVTVERTPLFRVVGEPRPLDIHEKVEVPEHVYLEHFDAGTLGSHWERRRQIAEDGVIVDHDPAKYAPYTDLVHDGKDTGYGYGPYYLLEIV
jgi:hypothetical protein